MSIFKARGIIIKEFLVGDNDKALTILLKDYGKCSVWVKNCRGAKSKLLSSMLFSYADFLIYDSGKSLSINQIDVIENFYKITENLDALAYSTYLLEFIDKNTQENIQLNDIILLLIKSLTIIKSEVISPKLVAKIFELKFLQLNGYSPQIDVCSCCSKNINIDENNEEFFLFEEGLLCNNCKKSYKNVVVVSKTLIKVIKHILNTPINNVYNFNVSDNILSELSNVVKIFLNFHFQMNLKSVDFIQQIENI